MRVVTITNREMKKRTGMTCGAYTAGKTIYKTPKAGLFVMEHEKAHIKLKHRPARLTPKQFVRRELKADKIATESMRMKYKRSYLDDIANDTSNRFNMTRTHSRRLVRGEAKDIGLI